MMEVSIEILEEKRNELLREVVQLEREGYNSEQERDKIKSIGEGIDRLKQGGGIDARVSD